jgi:hypothetical protein
MAAGSYDRVLPSLATLEAMVSPDVPVQPKTLRPAYAAELSFAD